MYSCYRKVAFADREATVIHLEMLIPMRFSVIGLNALEKKKKRREIGCANSRLIYFSLFFLFDQIFLQTLL